MLGLHFEIPAQLSSSQASTLQVAKGLLRRPLTAPHNARKRWEDNLPPSCDLWQRQAVPRPASYPGQSEIEKVLVRPESYLPPKTSLSLTAATATESGLLDCTILLLEGIRVHTTWPLSGCARAAGCACVCPASGRLPQSAFSFELRSARDWLYFTRVLNSEMTQMTWIVGDLIYWW